jgi:hypothetical protein
MKGGFTRIVNGLEEDGHAKSPKPQKGRRVLDSLSYDFKGAAVGYYWQAAEEGLSNGWLPMNAD